MAEQLTPTTLALALQVQGGPGWRVEGPRVAREWQATDADDWPTGSIIGVTWSLVWQAPGTDEPAIPIAQLTVNPAEPAGPITAVSWRWPVPALVMEAAGVLRPVIG